MGGGEHLWQEVDNPVRQVVQELAGRDGFAEDVAATEEKQGVPRKRVEIHLRAEEEPQRKINKIKQNKQTDPQKGDCFIFSSIEQGEAIE